MDRATNSALMRQKNEKIILSLIARSPISRAEISKITGLTRAAVTIIIDDLKSRNIITEKYVHVGSVGRNPVMLYLNGNAIYFVGINITRLDITVGISDFCGKLLDEKTLPQLLPDKAFPAIKDALESMIARSGVDRSKIYKCSVVTPGPVNIQEGKTLNPPNFTDWHDVSVTSKLSEMLDFEVLFGNVSSAVALAEKYFGAAQNNTDFLALQVDEGIGSGIIADGVLFDGPCELGHTSIKYDGAVCKCGNRGCLELYASIPNLLKGTPNGTWQEVVDKNCLEIIENEAKYLSGAIISASHIFNLENVVLCGDIAYKPGAIINQIMKCTESNIFNKDKLKISAGMVKSKSLVAASIAIDNFFKF